MSERVEIQTKLEKWRHQPDDPYFSGPNAYGGL